MKRPNGVSAAGLPSLVQREASVCLSLFPTLCDLLTDPNWEDLSPKGKICLMLFIDDTAVRVLLKLEADCLKTSCVGRTVDDALAALDQMLKTGQVIWEQDQARTSGSYKKKK